MVPLVDNVNEPDVNEPDVSISTNINAMEKLWAKELYELSVKDREIINDELHGVSVSDMLTNRNYLDDFQIEIDTNIALADKKSYL